MPVIREPHSRLTQYPSDEQYPLPFQFAYPVQVSELYVRQAIGDASMSSTNRLLAFNNQSVHLIELTDDGLPLKYMSAIPKYKAASQEPVGYLNVVARKISITDLHHPQIL